VGSHTVGVQNKKRMEETRNLKGDYRTSSNLSDVEDGVSFF
jgi:hypothetical protein